MPARNCAEQFRNSNPRIQILKALALRDLPAGPSPEAAMREGVAGAGFEVALEIIRLSLFRKVDVGHELPRYVLRRVR